MDTMQFYVIQIGLLLEAIRILVFSGPIEQFSGAR